MESRQTPCSRISAIIQRRTKNSRATKKGHVAQLASAEEEGMQIPDTRSGVSQTRKGAAPWREAAGQAAAFP